MEDGDVELKTTGWGCEDEPGQERAEVKAQPSPGMVELVLKNSDGTTESAGWVPKICMGRE